MGGRLGDSNGSCQHPPKPVSNSASSLRFNSSSSRCSVVLGLPALRSLTSSWSRGSLRVMNTDAMSDLSEARDKGDGEEREWRKKRGRKTGLSAWGTRSYAEYHDHSCKS